MVQNGSRNKIEYAIELTEIIDVGEIKRTIQDKLFSIVNPELYSKYLALLKDSRVAYKHLERSVITDLEALLKKINAKTRII